MVRTGADLADGLPVPGHLDVVIIEDACIDAEDRQAGGGATVE